MLSYLLNHNGDKKSFIMIGEVVDDFDPKGANRVKVKLFGRTDNLSEAELPFYSLRDSVGGSPNANVDVPPKNSLVEVEYKGDIYNCVIISTLTNIAPK